MKATLIEAPPKEEEREGKKLQEDRAKKRSVSFQSHLELSLGISLNTGGGDDITSKDAKGGDGGGACLSSSRFLISQDGLVLHQRGGGGLGHGVASKRWFSEAGCSFIDPWSLAARQEKAALEQAHQKPCLSPSLPRVKHQPPPPPPPSQPQPVVGWPPVRTFRRNLGGSQLQKPEMGEEKEAKKTKAMEEEEKKKKTVTVTVNPKPESKATTMFVKVNMEGYAVGRKIDLKAHNSYESLSLSLQNMFENFLTANSSSNSKGGEKLDDMNPNYILLYEDNEGDRMLVGDVPWEMFLASVQRLYITLDPRASQSDDGRVGKEEP